MKAPVTFAFLFGLTTGILSADPMASFADSLPAFKSDSATQDPFKQVESGLSPFSTKPAGTTGTRADSGAHRIDSVTAMLRKRKPGIAAYFGIDFIDFGAKDKFEAALNARTTMDSLKTLQNYEPVHLAIPIGIQGIFPISTYLDLVAKTHSYWYKQTAILGNKTTNAHAGDEWYVSQANLGGAGMRYSLPPALLSVTGQLGLYTQGVWYWNLGGSELYSPYGSAPARYRPWGSGYELQFGFQQTMIKPWKFTGAIGFLHQEFTSDNSWSQLLRHAPPPGKVSWNSSAIQANLSLWYHFGISDSTLAPTPKLPSHP